MKVLHSMPAADGFRMPGEFEPHAGTILIWPVRPGSWPYEGKEAKQIFAMIARAIAEKEKVYILCDDAHIQEVQAEFAKEDAIIPCVIPSDDAWARDVGPTFVVNDEGTVRGIDWQFNAWGGTYDGLYAHWDKDNAVAMKFCKAKGYDVYNQQDFVLEGGSIHSDGEGTVLVTESCLLSKGRNPQMSKEQIEFRLKETLGAEKVIWLPRGIYNDETNEHVDNVCAFVKPGEVLLAWTDDENDPQYELSKLCLDTLSEQKDAKGRNIRVHKMLIPQNPVTIREEELEGYTFEEGEDTREVGERLAASYVNFYIANGIVCVPQFGDPHDEIAVKQLAELFPERKVVPISARAIIVGGGNIHCITQQIPAGKGESR